MKDCLIKCVYGMALVIIAEIVVSLFSPESISISGLTGAILILKVLFAVAVVALLSDINNKLGKNK